MKNIFAFTETDYKPSIYPGFVSINKHDDGTFSISVRKRGDDTSRMGSVVVSPETLEHLAVDIIAYLGDESGSKEATEAAQEPVQIIASGMPVENIKLDAACYFLKHETVFDGDGILEGWNALVQFYLAHRSVAHPAQAGKAQICRHGVYTNGSCHICIPFKSAAPAASVPVQAVTLTDGEIREIAAPYHTIYGFNEVAFVRDIERRLLAGSANKTGEAG